MRDSNAKRIPKYSFRRAQYDSHSACIKSHNSKPRMQQNEMKTNIHVYCLQTS